MPRNRSRMRALQPGRLHAPTAPRWSASGSRRCRRISRSRRSAWSRAAASPAASSKVPGSRLSMKCRRGGVAQRADAGHAVAGKLRQRLPAEARAAGAEHDDVGRAVAPAGAPRRAIAGEIVVLAGSRSSGSAAVGMARAQPVERALRRASSASSSASSATPCCADVVLSARCRWIAMNRHRRHRICRVMRQQDVAHSGQTRLTVDLLRRSARRHALAAGRPR